MNIPNISTKKKKYSSGELPFGLRDVYLYGDPNVIDVTASCVSCGAPLKGHVCDYCGVRALQSGNESGNVLKKRQG